MLALAARGMRCLSDVTLEGAELAVGVLHGGPRGPQKVFAVGAGLAGSKYSMPATSESQPKGRWLMGRTTTQGQRTYGSLWSPRRWPLYGCVMRSVWGACTVRCVHLCWARVYVGWCMFRMLVLHCLCSPPSIPTGKARLPTGLSTAAMGASKAPLITLHAPAAPDHAEAQAGSAEHGGTCQLRGRHACRRTPSCQLLDHEFLCCSPRMTRTAGAC